MPASPRYYTFDYTDTSGNTLTSNPHKLVGALPPCASGNATQVLANNATDPELLLAFRATFTDWGTAMSTWELGTDPCSDHWHGISCNDAGLITQL